MSQVEPTIRKTLKAAKGREGRTNLVKALKAKAQIESFMPN